MEVSSPLSRPGISSHRIQRAPANATSVTRRRGRYQLDSKTSSSEEEQLRSGANLAEPVYDGRRHD